MLRKAKHSKRRGFHGTSNLMPHSSSHVHSTLVEPPLQPSLAPQSCVPSYSTAIPPSIPTAQNLVSASHPPLRSNITDLCSSKLEAILNVLFWFNLFCGHNYGSIVDWYAVQHNWIFAWINFCMVSLCIIISLYLHGTDFSFLFELVTCRNVS